MPTFSDLVLAGLLFILIVLEKRILKKMAEFDAQLDTLEAETSGTRGAVDSAVVLINGLSDKLDAALADDANAATRLARVQAVNTELKNAKEALAQAVADNPVPEEPAP